MDRQTSYEIGLSLLTECGVEVSDVQVELIVGPHIEAARNELAKEILAEVQEMREQGETDLRSLLWTLRGILESSS